jgi:hypothetical protein
VSAADSQVWQELVIRDLTSTSWRGNLMLAFNRSLLNKEYK